PRRLHARRRVEQEHAVVYARRFLAGDLVDGERELTGGDHAGETVEDLDVDALQLTRPAADGRRRLPRQDPHKRVPAAHGDALHARPLAPVDAQLAVDDLAQLPGPGHDGALELVDQPAHLIFAIERLARRGPDLAENDEALAVA